MILWGAIWGGAIGFLLGHVPGMHALLGAILGALAGASLRKAMQSEVDDRIAEHARRAPSSEAIKPAADDRTIGPLARETAGATQPPSTAQAEVAAAAPIMATTATAAGEAPDAIADDQTQAEPPSTDRWSSMRG